MKKSSWENKRILSVLEHILEDMHVGICITDGNGIILRTGKSCELLYGIKGHSYDGKHISVLEKEGTFSPSLTLIALKERRKVVMMQPDKTGHQLLVTATPIFAADSDEIIYVISYASWDSSNILELQKHYHQLQKEITRSQLELSALKKDLLPHDIIAFSPKMKQITQLIDKIKEHDVQILITGETGTGKSSLAKHIHKASNINNQPFGQMCCSAFSGHILEDELFGYVSVNSTTGEEYEKMGLCEILDSGVIFLNDIENMSWETQGTLLYLLKNKCYYKRNCKDVKKVNLRVIASSRKSPDELAKELREELFYMLSVVSIQMPSLKTRRDDVPYFIDYFLKLYNDKYNKQVIISKQARELLIAHNWPGNINELKYIIQQLILNFEEDIVLSYHLPESISPFCAPNHAQQINLTEYLEYYEKRLVLQAYQKCKTTVNLAKYLGISQATAVRKLQKYLDNDTIQ